MDSAAGIGGASDKPDAVIKDEASSYLYMRVWSEDLGPAVNIQTSIGTQ
jgi:hypothetical protein